jgi:hypothetical protein
MANPGLSAGNDDKILYGNVCDFNAHKVLVEYTSKADRRGVSSEIFKDAVLPKMEDHGEGVPAACVKYNNMKIYYTCDPDGFAVAHICTENYKVQYSLMFQKRLIEDFKTANLDVHGRCHSFEGTLKESVIEFTDHPPHTSFDAVREKQEQIKDVLIDNIEQVVKRHGQIEITLDQTESLKETSQKFSDSSKKVKQRAVCELYKSYAIAAGVAIVLIGIIVIIICVTAKC